MKTRITSALISDGQRLVSASYSRGPAIRTYDDGFGPLFIHRDSMGVSGIVRAQTWEDAYSICEDEFFPAGDEDARKDQMVIAAMECDEERAHAQACFDEAFGYRPSGARREKDGTMSSIYAKDLNGDRLDLLTPELLADLGVTLTIENED